jgi:hypothetical protein
VSAHDHDEDQKRAEQRWRALREEGRRIGISFTEASTPPPDTTTDEMAGEVADGIRERILAAARVARLSPKAWLRTKNLDPAEFGFTDEEPETKTTTAPKDPTQSQRDRERAENAAQFVADVERLERQLAAAKGSR